MVGPGVFAVTFTSTRVLPDASVTASYRGARLDQTRAIPFAAVPVPTVMLSVSSTVVAAGCGTVAPVTASVVVRGRDGKPVQGVDVSFSVDGVPLTSVATDAQGLAVAVVGAAGVLRATVVVGGQVVEAVGSPVTLTVSSTGCPAVTMSITQPAAGSVVSTGTPRVSGTSQTGAVVTVREGGAVVCSAVTDALGVWSCAPLVPLVDGSHVLVATAVAGSVSASAQVVLVVDTGTPPTVGVVMPVVRRGDTQTISGSGWYPGESVHVTVHSAPVDVGVVTARADGTLPPVSFKVPSGFAVGVHQVSAVGSVSGTHVAAFQVTAGGGGGSSGGKAVGTGGTVAGGMPWGILLAVAAWAAGLATLAFRRARVRRQH